MAARKILILGGTGPARSLAALLMERGANFISSLAGRTDDPILPIGPLRVGGFGGVEGLQAYCAAEKITTIADCTHPFAAIISASAAQVAENLQLEYFRLERPEWEKQAGDQWMVVSCMGAAADSLLPGARVMLTTGLKDLPAFFSRPDISGIARMMGKPQVVAPEGWRIIQERPPFTLESEVALMRAENISILVTKNSGGAARAKLDAARELGLPVVMLKRPEKPAAKMATDAGTLAELLA